MRSPWWLLCRSVCQIRAAGWWCRSGPGELGEALDVQVIDEFAVLVVRLGLAADQLDAVFEIGCGFGPYVGGKGTGVEAAMEDLSD